MRRLSSRQISNNGVSVSGSTLLEVLICLCIIVILAQGAHALVTVRDSIALKSAIELFIQCIEAARARAQASGVPRVIVCDIYNHTYEIDGVVHPFPAHVQFGIRSGVLGPPSTPSNKPASSVTFPKATITISEQGVIASGAAYITDIGKKRQFCVTCAVGQQRCIRCYEYTDSWRLLE